MKADFEQFLDSFNALADSDLKLWCGVQDPPSAEEFGALEARLGWHFPEGYRRFVLHFGGAMLEAKETVWPRAKAYDVGPYWTFQSGWICLGIGHGIPDHLNIVTAATEFAAAMEGSAAAELMPFFREAQSADFYCFDRTGRIRWWSHETREADEPVKDDSFYAFILRETRELVARKNRIKAGDRG